ncbi:hypothetical protein BJX63DRAFT_435251 [Aspergillus granulosus]|uniref:NADP-dependent oxidoreductase domain-containing protein n=1 Tax=Aspergillus granulosus TaxID=176169 RepID=A0ABR4H3C9_9EURO
MSLSQSGIKVVFGAMTVGQAGEIGWLPAGELGRDLGNFDVFQHHGHSEVDTSRAYAKSTSESLLGKNMDDENYTLGTEDLRRAFGHSIEALHADTINLWHLRAPDRKTPLEIIMREVDRLHSEGKPPLRPEQGHPLPADFMPAGIFQTTAITA